MDLGESFVLINCRAADSLYKMFRFNGALRARCPIVDLYAINNLPAAVQRQRAKFSGVVSTKSRLMMRHEQV